MSRDLGKLGARHERRQSSSHDWLHLVDVVDLMEQMDCHNIRKATGDEIVCSCPFPGHGRGDLKPSLYMNDGSKEKSKATVWKCHGCGRSGNAVSFVAEIEGESKQKAAIWLREHYAPGFRAPKGGKISIELEEWMEERQERTEQPPVFPHVIPWDDYYENFGGIDWRNVEAMRDEDPIFDYMFSRGFTVDTLNEWRIGYDEKSDRLIIPVVNEHGELVGLKGRAWKSDVKPKYMIVGDRPDRRPRYGFPHYDKSLVMFGLYQVIEAGERWAVICEGELDVIALWQVGIPAISSGSAHLSDEQSILVRDALEEVVVFYDTDTAGKNATWGYYDEDGDYHPGLVAKLMPFIRVRVVRDHYFDPSKMVEMQKAASLKRMIRGAKVAHHYSRYAMIPPLDVLSA